MEDKIYKTFITKSEFLDKFNRITENKFDFFRLKNLEFLKNLGLLKILCIYNEIYHDIVLEKEEIIKQAFGDSLDCNISKEIELLRCHFDEEFLKKDLLKFFSNYKIFAGCISEEDVVISKEDSRIVVEIKMLATLIDFFDNAKVFERLNTFLTHNYAFDYKICLKQKEEDDSKDITLDDFRLEDNSRPKKQKIILKNVIKFIGKEIKENASCIKDAKEETPYIVLSGKVMNIKKLEYKKEEKKGQYFYRFDLNDTTSSISCIYYPTLATEEKIQSLQNDMQIVCSGSIKEWNGRFNFYPKVISIAEVEKVESPKIFKRKPPNEYRVVFPKIYENIIIDSFEDFYVAPQKLIEQTFCVFDCETTGLSSINDRIIEIGACKIENGLIKETFSTFVNPKVKLSSEIIKLTGITDKQIENAPLISDVLLDFYKFCSDSVLVGHNVEFDYDFISVAGRDLDIIFDNKRLDTLSMAREKLTLKSNKLVDVAKFFGVINENAHRAIHDAITTAKIFIKLYPL